MLRGTKRYGDLKAVEFGAVAAGSVRVCCSLERFKIAERERVDLEAESTPNANIDIDVDVDAVIEVEPKRKMKMETQCESKMESDSASKSRLKSVEKAVIEELRRWKAEQQRLWLQRVEVLEAERLKAMESEFAKNEEIRWQQLRRQKAEIMKLEKKLKCSLYDIEGQEKKVKSEQSRLEDRRRELEQIYKLKTAELVGALKRARNDNKAEQETLNRTIQFLQNENELISNKYRHEEKRCNEFRAELNRHKRQFDASSMGQLQIENDKLKHQLLCSEDTLKAKNEEIQKAVERAAEQQRTIETLQRERVDVDRQQLQREKQEMNRLRVELMAKSHFKQIRGDRTELQTIKQALHQIMNQKQDGQ